MKLILIRHGDPDYDNDCLTRTGEMEAKHLAESLDEKIDSLYFSPQGRATQTGQYIAEKLNIQPKTLPWLRELNGNYQDRLWAWSCHGCDIMDKHINWNIDYWHQFVPYGEHMRKVSEEFYDDFDNFMKECGYAFTNGRFKVAFKNRQTVALICHAGVILTILSRLLNIPLPVAYCQFTIQTCSKTVLRTSEKNGYAVFKLLSLIN